MLTSLHTDLWAVQLPNRFMGLQFGVRMTIIRLSDGSLLLHSPVEAAGSHQ